LTVRVHGRHLSDAAQRDYHRGLVGFLHTLHLVNVRNLLEERSLGVVPQVASAGSGDLQVEVSVGSTDARLALHEQRRDLQRLDVRRGEHGRERREWDADVQVGAEVGDQVLPHALGCAPGERGLKGGERKAGALDGAERDDRDALRSVWARGRQRHVDRCAAPIHSPDAHHPYEAVGLSLGDELLDVAVGHHQESLAGVRLGPHAVGVDRRGARRADEQR
jgi:hypothetical protein